MGGKASFDDFVRGLRPRFLARRTFQGTVSRNRRNVAVSRAQSVAVVVCSPRLMWTSATPSSRCGWSACPADSLTWRAPAD
jgi:hypothetical protein